MRKLRRSLRRDDRGSAAVEFAAVAMPLMIMMFGVVEYGRLMWAQEALQQVAAATARCMAMTSTSCASAGAYSSSNTQSYVISQAQALGLTLTNANITLNNDTVCAGVTWPSAGFSTVTLTYSFSSIAPSLLHALNGGVNLSATSCYPNY